MSVLMKWYGFPPSAEEEEFPSVLFSTGGGYPPVNVQEMEDAVLVEFELPGASKEEVDLTITGGSLTLKVNRPIDGDVPPEKYYIRERFRGHFGRSVAIPGTVDAAQAKASFKNGILRIEIPKKAEALPRRVEVSAE